MAPVICFSVDSIRQRVDNMTQTPLDRLKVATFQIAQWWAFINAVIVVYGLLTYLVFYEVLGYRESEIFLYEAFGDYAQGMGDGVILLVSPVLWLGLWIITGSARFLPWKHK